jgi:hypothetical protein
MAALANSLACGKYTTTDLLDRDFPKPPPARFFENLSIAQKKKFQQKFEKKLSTVVGLSH